VLIGAKKSLKNKTTVAIRKSNGYLITEALPNMYIQESSEKIIHYKEKLKVGVQFFS
jgi:hypothetical protein